jgi:hypothetical protein
MSVIFKMGLVVAHIISKVQAWAAAVFAADPIMQEQEQEEYHYIVVEVTQTNEAGATGDVHKEFIQLKVVKRRPNVEARFIQGMML